MQQSTHSVDSFLGEDFKLLSDKWNLTVHPLAAFIPYLHLLRISIAHFLVQFDFMKNFSHIRLPFISNGSPDQTEEKRSSSPSVQEGEKKPQMKGNRVQNIKMKIIHLSRSV